MTIEDTVPNISLSEYYMGRDRLFPNELTDAHKTNANLTVAKLNAVLEAFGQKRRIVSGWRPSSINAATKGASPTSRHVLCQAGDLEDNNRELMGWCLNNPDLLERVGVWMEDPRDTPTWIHLQTVPPKSGNRIFRP